MSSRQTGRVFQIPQSRLFACATELGEAIHKLGVQQRIEGGDGHTYGTDVGEVVGSVAFALDMLGFTTEASAGGFGKPPTLTVGHPLDIPTVEHPPDNDTSVEQVWKQLSRGRQGIARELATAALEGGGQGPVEKALGKGALNADDAAKAVAYKLWFLLWEGEAPR